MSGASKLRQFDEMANFLDGPRLSTALRGRRLYGLANGGRREALARDSKTIFHYKSLNTNWGKGSTVLVLFLSTFHYLGITSAEPPLSHLFDLFFSEVIEIYWACAE
jgi:hypothetical protein